MVEILNKEELEVKEQVMEEIPKDENEIIEKISEKAKDAVNDMMEGKLDKDEYLQQIKRLGLSAFIEEANKAKETKKDLIKINLGIFNTASSIVDFITQNEKTPPVNIIPDIQSCLAPMNENKDLINKYFGSKDENSSGFEQFMTQFDDIISAFSGDIKPDDQIKNNILEMMYNIMDNHNNKMMELSVYELNLENFVNDGHKGLNLNRVLEAYSIISNKRKINEYAKKFNKFFEKKTKNLKWAVLLGKKNKFDMISVAFYRSVVSGDIKSDIENNTDILRKAQVAAYLITSYVMHEYNDNTMSTSDRTALLFNLFRSDNPESNFNRFAIMYKIKEYSDHIYNTYRKEKNIPDEIEEAGEELNDKSGFVSNNIDTGSDDDGI